MLMNARNKTGWGHLSALKNEKDASADPVGFLWFYDCACPSVEMVRSAIDRVVKEKGDWTGDELSNAISYRWLPCACKFLPYDGGRYTDSYDLDLDLYAGITRKQN